MTNKKKKLNDKNNNKKILDNKKSLYTKYLVLGIAVLIAIAGVAISYPYFASSNANLESSSGKSTLFFFSSGNQGVLTEKYMAVSFLSFSSL